MPSTSSGPWRGAGSCWRWASRSGPPTCSTQALSLWRGRAFEDVEGWDRAIIEAGRLDELRLEAEELRVDACLRSGRHQEVLAAAESMVKASPLRERRWFLLVVGAVPGRSADRGAADDPPGQAAARGPAGPGPRAGAGDAGGGDPAAGRRPHVRGRTADEHVVSVPRPDAVRRRRLRVVLRPRLRPDRLPGPPQPSARADRRRPVGVRQVVAGAGRGRGGAWAGTAALVTVITPGEHPMQSIAGAGPGPGSCPARGPVRGGLLPVQRRRGAGRVLRLAGRLRRARGAGAGAAGGPAGRSLGSSRVRAAGRAQPAPAGRR